MKTLIESYTQLQSLSFNNEQISKISSNGGAQAMKTLIESYTQLQEFGFCNEQIVKIAANKGGAQAIKTVLESYQQLQDLGFRDEQIVRMASASGASQAIKNVLTYYTGLSSNNYNLTKITALAAKSGGAKKIQRLHERKCSTFPIPDEEPALNLDTQSHDLNFWSSFYLDYETTIQSDMLLTIDEQQTNRVCVDHEESPQMLCEENFYFIGNNKLDNPEELTEDDLQFFDEPVSKTTNGTEIIKMGIFTQSSDHKRKRNDPPTDPDRWQCLK